MLKPVAWIAIAAVCLAADEPKPQTPGVLGDGLVTYTSPAGWTYGKTTTTATTFLTAAHDGIAAISLLPTDVSVDAKARPAMLKMVTDTRKKAGSKVILAPVIEDDARFAVRIHERYEVGRANGGTKVADQTRYYREVGSRVVLVTVNTVADDPQVVQATKEAAEQMILSAIFHKAGERTPTTKPTK